MLDNSSTAEDILIHILESLSPPQVEINALFSVESDRSFTNSYSRTALKPNFVAVI
jgi:hypothetical protein